MDEKVLININLQIIVPIYKSTIVREKNVARTGESS